MFPEETVPKVGYSSKVVLYFQFGFIKCQFAAPELCWVFAQWKYCLISYDVFLVWVFNQNLGCYVPSTPQFSSLVCKTKIKPVWITTPVCHLWVRSPTLLSPLAALFHAGESPRDMARAMRPYLVPASSGGSWCRNLGEHWCVMMSPPCCGLCSAGVRVGWDHRQVTKTRGMAERKMRWDIQGTWDPRSWKVLQVLAPSITVWAQPCGLVTGLHQHRLLGWEVQLPPLWTFIQCMGQPSWGWSHQLSLGGWLSILHRGQEQSCWSLGLGAWVLLPPTMSPLLVAMPRCRPEEKQNWSL